MKRALLIAGVAAVSSALTAAAIVLPASAGGREDRPSSDRALEFEACMTAHGFELGPETTVVITRDGVRVDGKEVDAESFREAARECRPPLRHALPQLEGNAPPELRERLERMRDCMEGREP